MMESHGPNAKSLDNHLINHLLSSPTPPNNYNNYNNKNYNNNYNYTSNNISNNNNLAILFNTTTSITTPNTTLFNSTNNFTILFNSTTTPPPHLISHPLITGIIGAAKEYSKYHGYVSLVVCLLGVICNAFNIVVLTRKQLISSTNYFLTALAIADLLTMLSYIPISIHFYIRYGDSHSPDKNSYFWVVFLLFQANFSVTFHTVSIWLAVVLSAFRHSYLQTNMQSEDSSCFGVKCGGNSDR